MGEGYASAIERVQTIQRQLQVLQQAPPTDFPALLSSAVAPRPAPTTTAAAAGTSTGAAADGSSSWTAAVERPVALRVTPTALGDLTGGRDAADLAPVSLDAPAAGPAVAAVGTGGYANGRLPDEALVSIGGSDRLQPEAAGRFLEMRAAAAADGVTFRVNDSYRSLPEQEEMAARKGLYSQGGFAARPGTSNHGVGRSVDLGLDPSARAWMRENASRFGFRNDVAREPWHWTFTPARTA